MTRRLVEGKGVYSDPDLFTTSLSPDLHASIRRRIRWTAASRGVRLQEDAIDDLAQDLLLRLWERGVSREVEDFPGLRPTRRQQSHDRRRAPRSSEEARVTRLDERRELRTRTLLARHTRADSDRPRRPAPEARRVPPPALRPPVPDLRAHLHRRLHQPGGRRARGPAAGLCGQHPVSTPPGARGKGRGDPPTGVEARAAGLRATRRLQGCGLKADRPARE